MQGTLYCTPPQSTRRKSTRSALLQIVAMQLQHEQIMQNLRSSNLVEIRRALHNQSVDLSRQHQTQAEYAANGQAIAARDKALLELQELQVLHSELQIKVGPCCRLCSMSNNAFGLFQQKYASATTFISIFGST